MAERFVIDINLNTGKTSGSRQDDSGKTAATIGAGIGLASPFLKKELEKVKTKGPEWEQWKHSTGEIYKEKLYFPEYAEFQRKGLFSTTWKIKTLDDMNKEGNVFYSQSGGWVKENQKQLTGLATAAAWKASSAILDYANYTSGDKVANQNRAMSMKLVSYGSAIVLSGLNPFVIAGIIGNEVINAFSDQAKYKYDRQIENSQILNAEKIVGDASYGRRGITYGK